MKKYQNKEFQGKNKVTISVTIECTPDETNIDPFIRERIFIRKAMEALSFHSNTTPSYFPKWVKEIKITRES